MKQNLTIKSKKPFRQIWLILFGIVLSALFVASGCLSNSPYLHEKQDSSEPTPSIVYLSFRDALFQIKASELGLTIDQNSNQPYGVIMDWNVESEITTVVSYENGNASLFYSTNDGLLNVGNVEAISSVSRQLVTVAKDYVDKFDKVNKYPLPPVGYMRFYLLTPKGIYSSGDVDSHSLVKNGVSLSSLNDAAQDLILQLSLEFENK